MPTFTFEEVQEAPKTFTFEEAAADSFDQVSNPDARNLPDLQATTRGGPRVALPDADVARATFRESVGEGFGDVVTQPGIELPKLPVTPEVVQGALDKTRFASDYETSGEIPKPVTPQPPGTAAKVISGGIEGVDELARGVVGFFTSGPGMIQLGAAATPLAPAVYAKWTVDMLNAGFTSAKDAWDAFQKSDYRNASKNAAISFGSFLGAGAAAKHGYKQLAPVIDAVPRGDLQGVRVEEAQQKALEATIPPQREPMPLASRIEPGVAESGLRETVALDPTTDIRKIPTPIPETPTKNVPAAEVTEPGQSISKTPSLTKVSEETKPAVVKAEDIKPGDKIDWTPNESEKRYYGPISGIVADVVPGSSGGFRVDILAPLPGDPSRIVSVWDNRGRITRTQGGDIRTERSEVSKESGSEKPSLGIPHEKVTPRGGVRFEMAERASRTAMLSSMNDAIAKVDPRKAYDPEALIRVEGSKIDQVRDYLISEYNKVAKKQPTPQPTPAAVKETPAPAPKTGEGKSASASPGLPPTAEAGPTPGVGSKMGREGDITYEEGVKAGLNRREVDGLNAGRAIADIAREVGDLKKDPQKWLDSLVEIAKNDTAKLGKHRLHPSVAEKYAKDREVFLAPNKSGGVDLILGEPYWGVEKAAGKKGQKVAEFPSSRDAIADAYEINPPPPQIQGMGGAIPSEFKPSQQPPTALKNAAIDAQRAARGEPPLIKVAREKDPELWDRAMAAIDADWMAADHLIARFRDKPFAPTNLEGMILLHRMVDLKNEMAKMAREQARAYEEGQIEMAESAKAKYDAMLESTVELERITKDMGSIQGSAFRMRQLMMNDDFSMSNLIVRREAALKRKLNPEEISELEKISQEHALKTAELAKKEADLEAKSQEIEARFIAERAAKEQEFSPFVLKLAEDIVKSWDARADRAMARLREKWSRTSTGVDPTIIVDLSEIGVAHLARAGLDFTKWSIRMAAQLGDFYDKAKPFLKEAFERAKKLSEYEKEKRAGPKKAEVDKAIARPAPAEAIDGIVTRVGKRFAKNPKLDFSHAARKIARYYVEQGITKPMELVDAVHAKLVEAMPELTKRETMDALSGYGRFMPLKKDAVSVALRDATGQMQQIAKLEDMAGGKAPLKSGPERRVPTDEERRLIKQVEEKKKEGGYDVTDPEAQLRSAMQAAERRMQNTLKDLLHEIETRTRIVKNRRKLELDPKLKELKEKLEFVREVHSEVFAPAPLTDAQRLAKWKERTQDKIAEYRERLVEGDFKPRKRPEQPRLDPEAVKLRYELHKVHNALMDMRLKDQLKQRTQARKIVDGVANLIRFSRAVMTGGEFSAVLRQGGFTAFSHPILSAKALKPMFEALMDEKAQFKINEEIQTRPNAPLYERNKLQFTESGVRLSSMEEHYMFRVSEKIGRNPLAKYPLKAINAFQRAYVTYLNRVRADAFDKLLDTYGDSPEMQNQIANLINVATGRGSTAVGKYVGPGANTIFFAPRYTISRLQLLTGQPAWGGNAATRKMVAQEYGRALAGAAVVYSLGLMAGGTLEDDPRHPDFGKIKLDNTRIDPLFGLAQWTRLLATEISGERKTAKGKEVPIRGKVPFGQPTGADVAFNFSRSKLSPMVGAGVSLAAGKDVVGRKFNLSDAVIQSVVPITYGDILKAMEEQGVEKGTAIAVLALFGMGVQTYDVNEKRKD